MVGFWPLRVRLGFCANTVLAGDQWAALAGPAGDKSAGREPGRDPSERRAGLDYCTGALNDLQQMIRTHCMRARL